MSPSIHITPVGISKVNRNPIIGLHQYQTYFNRFNRVVPIFDLCLLAFMCRITISGSTSGVICRLLVNLEIGPTLYTNKD